MSYSAFLAHVQLLILHYDLVAHVRPVYHYGVTCGFTCNYIGKMYSGEDKTVLKIRAINVEGFVWGVY